MKWADITALAVSLLLLFTFLSYFQTKAVMTSPLIPGWAVEYSMKPEMVKGSLLSFGLLTGLSLRLAGFHRGQLITNVLLILLALVFNYAYAFILS